MTSSRGKPLSDRVKMQAGFGVLGRHQNAPQGFGLVDDGNTNDRARLYSGKSYAEPHEEQRCETQQDEYTHMAVERQLKAYVSNRAIVISTRQ